MGEHDGGATNLSLATRCQGRFGLALEAPLYDQFGLAVADENDDRIEARGDERSDPGSRDVPGLGPLQAPLRIRQ
jgi:hypothetical protein